MIKEAKKKKKDECLVNGVAVKIRKEWIQKMNWENVPWGTLGCVQKGRESSVIDDDHSLFTLSIQKDAVCINRKKRIPFGVGDIHFWICRGGSENAETGPG